MQGRSANGAHLKKRVTGRLGKSRVHRSWRGAPSVKGRNEEEGREVNKGHPKLREQVRSVSKEEEYLQESGRNTNER